jgi:nucleotidyltransferase/DNA polymerase involved in DNA repair
LFVTGRPAGAADCCCEPTRPRVIGVLARFAIDVEKKLSITVSIGLSCNKFLAKIASDLSPD